MKTIKLIAVLILVATATMSFAKSNSLTTLPVENIVYISIDQAHLVPGLVTAMHRQLSPFFLYNNQKIYTVDVKYSAFTYRITGTYDQWVDFFWPKAVNIGHGRTDQRIR